MLSAETVDELKRRKPKKILLQIPEGLKTKVLELAKEIEKKTGADVLISCDPCFGACDLRDSEAEKLGCDLLLHIGHSDLGLKTKTPVMYEEYRMDFDAVGLLEKNMEKLKPYKSISLLSTIQYVHLLDEVKKFLENNKRNVYIGLPKKAKHPGQILGCDFSAAETVDREADAHLFFGTGLFHPLGLATKVKKPVLFLDFEKSQFTDLSKEKEIEERLREMHIAEAKDLRNFGILVSTKPGQMNIGLAETIKRKLEQRGKNAYVLVMDEITPEKLLGLKLECLVNTACPRIVEDMEKFGKIIMNAEDINKLLD